MDTAVERAFRQIVAFVKRLTGFDDAPIALTEGHARAVPANAFWGMHPVFSIQSKQDVGPLHSLAARTATVSELEAAVFAARAAAVAELPGRMQSWIAGNAASDALIEPRNCLDGRLTFGCQFLCDDCHGERRLPCPVCHRARFVECPACKGEKTLPCSKCHGKKEVKCGSCGGSGKLASGQRCPKKVRCPACTAKAASAVLAADRRARSTAQRAMPRAPSLALAVARPGGCMSCACSPVSSKTASALKSPTRIRRSFKLSGKVTCASSVKLRLRTNSRLPGGVVAMVGCFSSAGMNEATSSGDGGGTGAGSTNAATASGAIASSTTTSRTFHRNAERFTTSLRSSRSRSRGKS